jgi:hypothetical protein
MTGAKFANLGRGGFGEDRQERGMVRTQSPVGDVIKVNINPHRTLLTRLCGIDIYFTLLVAKPPTII